MLSSNTKTEKYYETFLEKFESLLDTYAPLKKFLKINGKGKPWITPSLSTLLKKKKKLILLYQIFLRKDLKNMWKGTEKIISSNNFNHISPTAITVNNEAITNPSDIANAFNNCFTKVAIDIEFSLRFSKKKLL